MYFMDDYPYRELERLIRRIPNFEPRGHGVVVLSSHEYTAKDCDCSVCSYHKGRKDSLQCKLPKCVCLEERIRQFEEQNPPFMLYDHKDGSFSLGLSFTFLEGRYKNYGQEAFNRYAMEIGDPVKDGQFFTHGSGYEWETMFQKAFEQDKDLQRVDFGSEAGAFFCYADDLSLLEDFGRRFRAVCEDQENFSSLVCKALSEAEEEMEYHIDHNTVKYNIECHTRLTIRCQG